MLWECLPFTERNELRFSKGWKNNDCIKHYNGSCTPFSNISKIYTEKNELPLLEVREIMG